MFICKYCGKECKNQNSLRNHERLCKSNSNRQIPNTEASLQASWKKYKCLHCTDLFSKSNIKKHEDACSKNPLNKKECPVCKTVFNGESITCSYSCSNTLFRTGENNGNWKGKNYRSIAKIKHIMCCVVCGENKVVAVHHMDEDHSNNDPKNLVPLCPTHHQYMHSRYKYLIEEKVKGYILSFA